MDQYFAPAMGRKGRPRTCLPTVLRGDLGERGLELRGAGHLQDLRELASDRLEWRKIVKGQRDEPAHAKSRALRSRHAKTR